HNVKKQGGASWQSWYSDSEAKPVVITAENIAEVVSAATGIPVTRLTDSESKRLLHLEDELKKRVIGQDEAVNAVADAIRRSRSGLKTLPDQWAALCSRVPLGRERPSFPKPWRNVFSARKNP
ncbi:MAG: hypothetical protein K2J76_06825, partial [Oscillospiraceae bacterium]|nr:hypothetical protein [Oscillospiraceae bacterium]